MTRCSPPLGAFLMVLVSVMSAAAQELSDPACNDTTAPRPQVIFDHLNTNADRHYSISVRPNEPIIVCIQNTGLAAFTYAIVGVVKEVPGASSTASLSMKDLGTRRLTKAHDDQYGGYLVTIKRKAPETVTVVTGESSQKDLNDITLVIAVKSEQFQYEFAGAFSVNSLTDPQYALQPRTVDGQAKSFVVQDDDAEDSSRLGIGAFIHVFHDKFPYVAGTFGIGIAESSKTSYFLGPTLRLGKAMAFTAGPVWGSVSRLPSGVAVDSEARDSNVLNDLPTHIRRGWFFGVSYTFLQARQAIEKPFAPSDK
jgi:hypothetical protein